MIRSKQKTLYFAPKGLDWFFGGLTQAAARGARFSLGYYILGLQPSGG